MRRHGLATVVVLSGAVRSSRATAAVPLARVAAVSRVGDCDRCCQRMGELVAGTGAHSAATVPLVSASAPATQLLFQSLPLLAGMRSTYCLLTQRLDLGFNFGGTREQLRELRRPRPMTPAARVACVVRAPAALPGVALVVPVPQHRPCTFA